MNGGEAAAIAVDDSAETQYVKAKTSVWWDIENCHVPRVCDAFSIAQNINSALSKMNYRGPVSISAYGDTNRIPTAVQQSLSSTGITLNHVPAGVKDASDKKILVDMLFWAVDNPAPANYLLISGDRDFSYALHQLRMRNYNILLAQPSKASAALLSAAKTVWLWTSLVVGGGPTAKNESTHLVNGGNHFNLEAVSQSHISDPFPVYQPPPVLPPDSYPMGNYMHKNDLKNKAVAGSDPKYKVKNGQKNLNQPGLVKSQSMPMVCQESKNGEYNPQLEGHGRVYKAPHEFPGPNGHANFTNWQAPNNFHGNADPSAMNAHNFTGIQENQYTYPPRPRGFPPHANSAPGNMMIRGNPPFRSLPSRPERPTLPPVTIPSAPEIGKFSSSPFPNYAINVGQSLKESFKSKLNENSNPGSRNQMQKVHNSNMNFRPPVVNAFNRSRPDSSSALGGGGSLPPPSEHELELIGLILHALDCLKSDKMCPNEANLTDCICFGDLKYRNTDVKKALDVALKRQMVTKHALGELHMYSIKGQGLWQCVNPSGGKHENYSEEIWENIHNFLISLDGRSAISTSSSKYEGALKLKRLCLPSLPLGEVLMILNMLTGPKKWIKHNQYGWQPVTVTLTENSTEAATS